MRFISHPALRQGLGMLARRRCVLAMLLMAALMPVGTLWAQSAPGRNVLVLFSSGRLLPANVDVDLGLAEGLSARPEMRAELSAEFLDAPRFAGAAYADTMATYLREKYAAHAPDVIVAVGTEALDFVLSKRAQMFPAVPVIHQAVAVERLRSLGPLPADVIGVPVDLDFLGTARQALRWHPSARRLVVVTGSGEWDHDWQARVRQVAAKLDRSVSLEFLAGLPSEDLRQRLGAWVSRQSALAAFALDEPCPFESPGLRVPPTCISSDVGHRDRGGVMHARHPAEFCEVNARRR